MLAVSLSFTLGSQKAKAPLAHTQSNAAARYFHRDVLPSLQAETNVPSRISSTDESVIVPRGELSTTNSTSVLPDDYCLLRESTFEKGMHSREMSVNMGSAV